MNSYVQYESQYWFSLDMTLRMSESSGNLINPHNLAPASGRGENHVRSYYPVSLVNSRERAVKGARVFILTPWSFARGSKMED